MSEQSESELEEAVVILKLSRFCLVSVLRLYERSTTAVEEEVAGDDVAVVVVAASVAEAAAGAGGWMVVVEDNIRGVVPWERWAATPGSRKRDQMERGVAETGGAQIGQEDGDGSREYGKKLRRCEDG